MRHRILGQDPALETLARALRSGRLHHAWIFSGPKGVGKFTTAVEFARILLDPAAGPDLAGEIAADPDGHTSRLVDAGTHPDLHVIRKELALDSEDAKLRGRKLANLPLDVLREHVIGGRTGDDRFHEGPAYLTATLGGAKVFVIDEAELIDRYGQYALLKTLEEPPAGTYIVLVTSRPERLLPTIHSRAQHVRFGRLDAAAMAAWFERAQIGRAQIGRAQMERAQIELAPDERAWVETFCEGAPGIAALAVEYGFAGWRRTLAPFFTDLERGRFPVAMGDALAALVEEFAVAWVKRNRNASKDAANKDAAGHVLALLAAHARGRLADPATAPRAAQVIDLLRETERQLAFNVNLKQAFENLVVQWAASSRRQPVEA